VNDWLNNIIKNTKTRIIKQPFLYGFWAIIIIILIPSLIWFFYLIGDCGIIIVNTSLSADGALGFYGTLLSFLGTVALGALALWQNRNLAKANQDLTMLQLEEYSPYLIIEDSSDSEHLEPNRNPDTTQSILSGSKGFVTFRNSEEQKKYEDEQNRILQPFNTSELTPEFSAKLEESQIETIEFMTKLNQVITEYYTDSFWILKKDSEQLDSNPVQDLKSLEHKTLKFVFKNDSQAKIKKIVFDKMIFDCGMQKWIFSPNPQQNYVSKLLKKDESFTFYINLFWKKDDAILSKFLKLYSMYTIKISITLITVGGKQQKENIESKWSFGRISESNYDLT